MDKKMPGSRPGLVQQGGACDNPHMQRELSETLIKVCVKHLFDLGQLP